MRNCELTELVTAVHTIQFHVKMCEAVISLQLFKNQRPNFVGKLMTLQASFQEKKKSNFKMFFFFLLFTFSIIISYKSATFHFGCCMLFM